MAIEIPPSPLPDRITIGVAYDSELATPEFLMEHLDELEGVHVQWHLLEPAYKKKEGES